MITIINLYLMNKQIPLVDDVLLLHTTYTADT